MQQFDANLLLALNALLEAGSVTGAAERMNVSVPAMSRTLLRIRNLMGDPIMVPAGRGLVPTPRALEIRARVNAFAREAHFLITSSAASLIDVERTFTIRTEESFIGSFSPRLTAAVRSMAPGITLRFVSQADEGVGPLREGIIDLDIGNIKLRGPEVKVQSLFLGRFMGVVRPGHALTKTKITPKRYAEQEHISASRRGLQWGPIDDALAKLGLKRRIVLVVPSFVTALMAAASSDMVAAIPQHHTQSASMLYGLYVFPLPVTTAPVRISQAWHPRFDSDPVHRFVRECVVKVSKAEQNQATGAE